jgi:hypothetical protein
MLHCFRERKKRSYRRLIPCMIPFGHIPLQDLPVHVIALRLVDGSQIFFDGNQRLVVACMPSPYHDVHQLIRYHNHLYHLLAGEKGLRLGIRQSRLFQSRVACSKARQNAPAQLAIHL